MTATATRDDLKYSLDDPIGQGVFSKTLPATEVNSGQPVVIKTLAENLQEYPRFADFTRQFLALSQRLTACQHPALPGIWEYFEEDRCPYIVYDRIVGQSLAAYVAAQGPVTSERAIAWLRPIGEAVALLHQAQLYHLDIQPHNIILRHDTEAAVLVDFGLACELSPEIRQTHAQLLAPGYAAPERHRPQQPTSPATDVYSLSATLYFLVTGNAPPPALLLDRIPPDEWQQFPAGVSAAVKVAACRGLAIAPELRPPTAQTWLELLSLPPGVAEHLEAERQAQLTRHRQQRLESERQATEQRARWEAEHQARLEAERQARLEVEQQARLEAERQEAERQARLEAERQEAERQARLEAERQEAERRARLEAERQEAERRARLEAERQEAERQARLEIERQARLEAERQEAERQARLEIERQDADRHAQLEAERQRQVEAARLAAELREAQVRLPLDELEPSAPPLEAGHPTAAKATPARTTAAIARSPGASGSRRRKPKFPTGALLMTGAIAASAGVGFGLSLRLNRPHEPGSSIWHTEQSFPPRETETQIGPGTEPEPEQE